MLRTALLTLTRAIDDESTRVGSVQCTSQAVCAQNARVSRANAMQDAAVGYEGFARACAGRCVQRVLRLCEIGSDVSQTRLPESLVAC